MMMKKLISLLVLIIVAFPTVAKIPTGDYIMIDKKKGGFVRLCKSESTKELENITLTDKSLHLALPESTEYLILKGKMNKNEHILEVRNPYNIVYTYKIKKINNSDVYKWDAYLGNKRIEDLSFFSIPKNKAKNIISVGICK
ncbi:hypothetical protein ABLB96_02025 [Acinetobacter sp. XH1741]|uniref:hypothetical protein n=1 Tax=unclassified Acinetobacter TaxID=196816 RepID=UPI0032B32F32